jgi:hypothetical protein
LAWNSGSVEKSHAIAALRSRLHCGLTQYS